MSTPRFFVLPTIVFIFTLLASACTPAAPNASPSDPATQPADATFPVTIEHQYGTTTIPSQPKRVVTVGWNDQDFVIALGVIPVSTRAWFDEYPTYPWVASALGGQPLPSFGGEINFEAILKEKPDLILAIYEALDRATYDKLSKIAPTVVQATNDPNAQTPWDVQTLTTGKALGKLTEAQALVDQVNAKIAEVRAAHPEFAGKVLVEDYGPENGGHWLIPANDQRRALFDALGFAAQPEKEELSEERLDLIDRDILFINGASEADMLKSEVFAKLNVVKSGRTLYTTFDTPLAGALSYSGPNALLYAIDELVPQLAAALDGEKATPTPQAASAFPVTVAHRLGQTVIPTQPQRVVTLSNADADAAIVSGIIPVAMAKTTSYTTSGIAPWLTDKIEPATTQFFSFENEIPFETIATFKPDLILAVGVYGIDEASYAKLAQIAPTLIDLKGWGVETWQEQTVRTGQALGAPEKAQTAVKETEAAIQQTKADLPGLNGKTFSLSFMYGENSIASLRSTDDFAVKSLEALGLVLSPALVKETTDVTDNISLERLDLLDADLMIVGFMPAELQKTFEANPLTKQLNAIKNNGYLPVDLETVTTMRNPSVLGSRWVLEQLRAGLEKFAGKK